VLLRRSRSGSWRKPHEGIDAAGPGSELRREREVSGAEEERVCLLFVMMVTCHVRLLVFCSSRGHSSPKQT
jgi:hypothetical protein